MTTASEVNRALSRKYQPPEWCLYFEVADDTGAGGTRYADAVAMSIWPSRGYQLHGFEVKVSRSDFLSEMKDPSKADAVGKYCHHWWIVTPAKLVDPSELPETWGLLELTKAGLRVKKKAPKRDPAEPTRGFMAALLRRGQDMQQAHIRRAIEAGSAEREARVEQEVERRTKRLREDVEKGKEWRRQFVEAFGQEPSTFRRPEAFADRLRIAERLSSDYGFGVLETMRNTAASFVKDVDQAREKIGALANEEEG